MSRIFRAREAIERLEKLSYRLSELAAQIYGCAPRSLRRALVSAVIPAFSQARRLPAAVSQLRPAVHRIEGKERSRGRALAIVTCVREEALPFLLDLVFSEVKHRERLGRMHLRNFPGLVGSFRDRADMAFIHGDITLARSLAARGYVLLPEWVDMTLDLGGPLEKVWDLPGNKTLRENLRRIRKYHYAFEITTDRSRFEDFYREMYLPFIPAKFGAATRLVGPRKMRLFFDSGVLLLVRRDGQPVAGNVIIVSRGVARSLIIGLRHGDIVLLRQSALAASYYFTMLWAKGSGLRGVDFGGCRPLLRDGLFYFKKRWGMGVGGVGASKNVYGLRPLRLTPAVQDFLAANPFIYLDRDRLKGFILSPGDGPLTLSAIRGMVRAAAIPGLDSLTLLAPAGFASEAGREARLGRLGRTILRHEPLASYFQVGREAQAAAPGLDS